MQNNTNVQVGPMQQKTILFKFNSGLGYDTNSTSCDALESQKRISPQVAIIKSNTFEEANKRFQNRTHSYDTQAMSDYQKRYPAVFNSDLAGSKWAGIL
jgi:hypothetical protein